MAEMEAHLREVRADYRRLGDDVAYQQEQLWNQVPCLLMILALTLALTLVLSWYCALAAYNPFSAVPIAS